MMNETSVFRTMVVSSAIAALARQLASAIPSGLGMFVAGFSSNGKLPATHFISEGWVWEVFADALASPESLVTMLAQFGQTMSIEQATALLSQAIVSESPAPQLCAELGLQPAIPDMG